MHETPALELIRSALETVTGCPDSTPLTPDMALRDVGVTSMSVYSFVTALEERGGFTFRDEDVDSDNFETVGSVLSLLTRYETAADRLTS